MCQLKCLEVTILETEMMNNTVKLDSNRLGFVLFWPYLHTGFKQRHGIHKNGMVGLFGCFISNKLENILMMMLCQVGFKHLSN